jgi:hypothetical protein
MRDDISETGKLIQLSGKPWIQNSKRHQFAETFPIGSGNTAGLLSRNATQMSMSPKGLLSRKDPNKIARTQPLPRSKDELLVINACFSGGARGGDGLFM